MSIFYAAGLPHPAKNGPGMNSYFLGGNPHVLFLDYKMRELEVHNVTKWQPEKIANLIRSRGFKEQLITADHSGFKETTKYFEKLKASMTKEQHEKL